MTADNRFDQSAETFLEYVQSPWGRLRTEMIMQQLQRHLPQSSLRVLDAGAGNGAMVLPMAKAGYAVTATDFSAEMIARGRERSREAGVDVAWIECELFDLEASLERASFDVVLCHFVLPYVEDYQGALQVLARLLKPGGTLSLMLTNPDGRMLKTLLRDLDPAAVMNVEQQPTFPNKLFGGVSQQHRYEQITEAVNLAGMTIQAHYGVRVFMDLIMQNEIKEDADFYRDLLALEMAYCDRDPFRQIAASTHYIVGKG